MNSDRAQLHPQQADRFWRGKATRQEVQNGFDTIENKLSRFDLLLSYLAEKAGVTPAILNEWVAEKVKAAQAKQAAADAADAAKAANNAPDNNEAGVAPEGGADAVPETLIQLTDGQ